ncbi:hypothetical protein DFH94DRAFT_790183, partial [Russula ochroleuca]
MDTSDPVLAFYAQCAVAITLSSVQQRDDHWFQLAAGQLKEPRTVLRSYFADNDTILLDDAILIIRQTILAFSGSRDYRSDIRKVSLKTVELICNFDIQNTSEDLQHNFCRLWNELVDGAEKNTDPDFRSLCDMMLNSIRRLYITLHGTSSSRPVFTMTTSDRNPALGFVTLNPALGSFTLYPRCEDQTHNPSRPFLDLNSLTAWVATPSSPPAATGYPPYSIIPSPNFPITPLTGAVDPGVPGPYSHSAAPLPPDSPRMTPGEDVPAAIGEVYSRPNESSSSKIDEDDAAASSLASSNDTLSTPPPSIKKARAKKNRRPNYEEAPLAPGQVYPLSPIMRVSTPASPGPSATSRSQGHLGLAGTTPASQPGALVRFAPPESTTSSSKSPGIDIVPLPEPPESSPPVSPLHISSMALRGEDVPAAVDEGNSQQGANVRKFAPSESTSMSFSELQVINIVTPSRPESPYSATIPTPTPAPACLAPSIDVSLGPPRSPSTATVSLPGQMPMSGGG